MREDRLVLPIPPGVHWTSEMPILIPQVHNALPEPAKKERAGAPAERNLLKPIAVKSPRVQFGSPDREPAPVIEKEKSAKPKREKVKADPKHIAKARELRDRWLEKVKAPGGASVLSSNGKYEVSKALVAPAAPVAATTPLLEAA